MENTHKEHQFKKETIMEYLPSWFLL